MRFGIPVLGLLAGLCLSGASCIGIDCRGYNDSPAFFRGVPVPLPSPGALAAPGQADPAGSDRTLLSQTYTIERTGDFTLDQRVERKLGFLGIEASKLDPESAMRLEAEPYSGVLVKIVEKEGPAEKAGIQPDDIIAAFAGKDVRSDDQLEYLVEETRPWTSVEVQGIRKGARLPFQVTLGEKKMTIDVKALERKLPVLDDRARTGLQLVELDDAVRPIVLGPQSAEKGLLVIDVLPGGPAFFAGLKPRDLLVQINGQPVPALADYQDVLGVDPEVSKLTVSALRAGIPLEAELKTEKDATATANFNLLEILKLKRKPEQREFSLLLGLFCHSRTCYSVVKGDRGDIQCRQERGWGMLFDLIAARNTHRRKELRLLWLFPISWTRESLY